LDAKIWGSAVIIELWKGDRNHDGWSPNLVVARIFDNYGNAAHAVGYTCMLRGSNVNITLSGKM
jgi:hypothetical protein